MLGLIEAVPEDTLAYARHGLRTLTERELEVVRLMANAHSSKQIAALLELSHRTVEIYRSRILNKLGAKSSVDLVRILVQLQPSGDAA